MSHYFIDLMLGYIGIVIAVIMVIIFGLWEFEIVIGE